MKLKKLILMLLAVVILASLVTILFTKPVIFYRVKKWTDYEIWSDISGIGQPDESAPKEAAVTFNGVTYSGEYDLTKVEVPYLFKMHRYNGDGVDFYTNADTGELVKIQLDIDRQDVSTVDEEYCRQVADELAQDYIKLKKYEVEVQRMDREDNFICYFDYYREIGGYKTPDGLRISVDGNGNITCFESYMLGSFSNVLYVKTPNEDKVDEAFYKAIPELFDHRMTDNLIKNEYVIDDITIVKTPDGKIAYLYEVTLYYYYDAVDQDGVRIELKIHDDMYFVLV